MPESVCDTIETVLQKQEYPRKQLLLKKGQTCRHLYFIESGMARTYLLEEDREHTTDISLDGEILTVFSSFTARQPSLEYLELMEKSTLYAISYDQLQQFYQDFPALERTGRMIAEYYYNSLATKSYQIKFSSAKERYEQLIRTKPELVRRAPIGIIASYLGMSIETLSRIRSKAH